MMFTISVCMIVKNEELVIERILKCAQEFADEIIVVDTGSTDKTKEIAKKYTDKIFDFTWEDDFSSARNFSFEKATCDYQMWLDADDFISKSEIEKIKALKKQTSSTDVYMFKYALFGDLEKPILTYNRERLLKRESHFKWEGFVHEAISPQGEIEYQNITIEHRKIGNGEPSRNLKLYQNALKKGKIFNPREQYYYARELFYNGFVGKASKILTKFIKTKDTYPPDNYGARIMLCDCFLQKHNIKKAKKILFECLDNHSPTAEVCCKIGEVYNMENDDIKAIFWFKNALFCEKQTWGFVNESCQTTIPCIELSRLFYHIGQHQTAKQYHLMAKQFDANHPSVIYNDKFFQ